MDDAREPERAARVHEVMADWLTQCRNASGEIAQSMDGQDISAMKEVLEKLSSGNPEEMKKLILSVSGEDGGAVSGIPSDARKTFSRDGWAHVSEWLGDLPALGALRELHRSGLSVPRDIALVGCDNAYFAPYLTPSLTTVDLHPFEHGRAAMAELILSISAGHPISFNQTFESSLVVRESCGAALGVRDFG